MTNKYNLIENLKYVGFLILLYVFIYNPPFSFLPLTPVEVMLIPVLVYMTVFGRWANFVFLFKYEIAALLAIIAFCFLREIQSSGSVFFRANVLLILEVLVFPYFIVNFYQKIKNHNNLLKEIVFLGFLASLITLAVIVFLPLNEFIRSTLLKSDDFSEFVALRSFGLSEGLTFAYGTAQGIVFALIIYFSKYNAKYFFLLPFILISILFNARIGLVPVTFSLIYFVFIKFNVKFIAILTLIILVFYLVLFRTDFFADYAKTIEWAFDFFVQSSDFVTGNAASSDDNTFNMLFGEMAVLPQNTIDWIIGTGENIFLSKSANSDVGYIIQLNYGGITYILLFAIFVSVLVRRLGFLYKEYLWLVLLIVITIVVTNIKGIFISIIPSFRLIMLIYCYLVMENRLFKKLGGGIFNLYK